MVSTATILCWRRQGRQMAAVATEMAALVETMVV
jgi:hypothetical protein